MMPDKKEQMLQLTNNSMNLMRLDEDNLQVHLSPSYTQEVGGRIDYASHEYTEDLEDLDLEGIGHDLQESLPHISEAEPSEFTNVRLFSEYLFGGMKEDEFEELYNDWTETFEDEFPHANLNKVEDYEVDF